MGPWVLGARCPLPLCLCFWRRHPVTTALRPWPLRDWERGGRRSPLLLSARCPRPTDCAFYLEWPSAASLPPPPEPGPLGLALRHQFQIPGWEEISGWGVWKRVPCGHPPRAPTNEALGRGLGGHEREKAKTEKRPPLGAGWVWVPGSLVPGAPSPCASASGGATPLPPR